VRKFCVCFVFHVCLWKIHIGFAAFVVCLLLVPQSDPFDFACRFDHSLFLEVLFSFLFFVHRLFQRAKKLLNGTQRFSITRLNRPRFLFQ
jgi:hypothetical protein